MWVHIFESSLMYLERRVSIKWIRRLILDYLILRNLKEKFQHFSLNCTEILREIIFITFWRSFRQVRTKWQDYLLDFLNDSPNSENVFILLVLFLLFCVFCFSVMLVLCGVGYVLCWCDDSVMLVLCYVGIV